MRFPKKPIARAQRKPRPLAARTKKPAQNKEPTHFEKARDYFIKNALGKGTIKSKIKGEHELSFEDITAILGLNTTTTGHFITRVEKAYGIEKIIPKGEYRWSVRFPAEVFEKFLRDVYSPKQMPIQMLRSWLRKVNNITLDTDTFNRRIQTAIIEFKKKKIDVEIINIDVRTGSPVSEVTAENRQYIVKCVAAENFNRLMDWFLGHNK